VRDNPAFSDVLQVYMEKDRSYQCSLSSKNRDGNTTVFYFDLAISDPNGILLVGVPNGLAYPAITNAIGAYALTDDLKNRTRVSMSPSVTGLHTIALKERDSSTASQNVSFNCRETTLYGSFNRFFAQSAIVELRNASASDLQIKITIIDAGGNILVDKQNNVVRANTRSDIIFANLPAETYGQIIVNHTAPFGALSGYVSEYDAGSNGEIILKRERKLSVTPVSNSVTQ